MPRHPKGELAKKVPVVQQPVVVESDPVDQKNDRVMFAKIRTLYIKGKSPDEISDATGLSYDEVIEYFKRIKEDLSLAVNKDFWRGRLLRTYEEQTSELWNEWEKSKQSRITVITNPDGSQTTKQEPADVRWQSGILAVNKEISTLLGVRDGADSVNNIVIDQSVKNTLAPLSPDDYMRMIEAGPPNVTAGVDAMRSFSQPAPIQQPSHGPQEV